MDLKLFKTKDGGIIQIIAKDKMQNWPVELPLIFIEYIRSNQLDSYGSAKKEVETYLDEVMKDVAVPRLISVLEGNEDEIIISALERIEELSKKNIEMTTPIKPYLNNLIDSKNKNIVNLAQNISKVFERAAKNKVIAKNRKIMREKEKDFLAGKINAEEYAKLRKEYLTLKG